MKLRGTKEGLLNLYLAMNQFKANRAIAPGTVMAVLEIMPREELLPYIIHALLSPLVAAPQGASVLPGLVRFRLAALSRHRLVHY